jgi:hypothetical protein
MSPRRTFAPQPPQTWPAARRDSGSERQMDSSQADSIKRINLLLLSSTFHQASPRFSVCRPSRLGASSPILPVYDIMYSHLQMWSISNRCYGVAPATATPGRRMLYTSTRSIFLLIFCRTSAIHHLSLAGRLLPARGRESGQPLSNGLARSPFQMYPACQHQVNIAGPLSEQRRIAQIRASPLCWIPPGPEGQPRCLVREVQGDNLYEQIWI